MGGETASVGFGLRISRSGVRIPPGAPSCSHPTPLLADPDQRVLSYAFGQAVADAADRLDDRGAIPEFSAQRPDQCLDHIAAAGSVVAPDVSQQRPSIHDAALMMLQVVHHLELQLGEVHAPAVDYQRPLHTVQQRVVFNLEFVRDHSREPAVDRRRAEVEDGQVMGNAIQRNRLTVLRCMIESLTT